MTTNILLIRYLNVYNSISNSFEVCHTDWCQYTRNSRYDNQFKKKHQWSLLHRAVILVGIETTVVFWPVRLKESGRVLFFRFELWDCGESAIRRFDHMLPVSISIILQRYLHSQG